MKKFVLVVIVSFVSGILGSYTYNNFLTRKSLVVENGDAYSVIQASNTAGNVDVEPIFGRNEVRYDRSRAMAENVNFVKASATSTNSVVYIKNISEKNYRASYFDWFFGGGSGSQVEISSGSGVIFTEDGYIVTNNHVVDDADQLEVIHNKKTYEARLVGTDPATDLAVLKIEAESLPVINLGSSKGLNVGEWVIAVGNPFNLTSTVTAGIVSAKGREIHILKDNFPIESFIQTDAAINPGNSGGALVNIDGELVGINTAIISKTGSYAGYGFAVPVDIVKKIVGDIIKYGEVQKAFFGGEVADLDSELANRLDVSIDEENIEGVLLIYLQNDGAASKVGMKEGDIITKLNGQPVDSRSMFEEELSYRSPGDRIQVTYKREGKEISSNITLTNREGTTKMLRREIISSKYLGAKFEAIPKVEKDLLGVDYGVKIVNVSGNGLIARMGIREGFIVTDINNNEIKDPDRLIEILENIKGRVIIEGVNSQGREGYYSFYFR
ncbi:MAG: trypsin-like peptidase domain-containing protein [Bacteroidota bacterium]